MRHISVKPIVATSVEEYEMRRNVVNLVLVVLLSCTIYLPMWSGAVGGK